jgi:hypothetical protein
MTTMTQSQIPVVYPLHVGDLWEFSVGPGSVRTVRVVGDTIMPNGLEYAIVENRGSSTVAYERYDRYRMYRFDLYSGRELLYYDFSRSVGDTIASFFLFDTVDVILTNFGVVPLFGESRPQWTFWFRCRSAYDCDEIHIVVDSLGLTSFHWGWGSYSIQGAVVNGRMYGTVSAVSEVGQGVPQHYSLDQNYPNPFNPVTTIQFRIPASGHVRLAVYDILGREVALLVNKALSVGSYEVQWHADQISSGAYFYRLVAGPFVATRRLTLLR